ncbi:TetR/AcrR family transcriptional regulator [Lentzea sp. BCCO 10_0061]|uniref:TetR/AcrR family transcriptional regulator n=1 Tax=Lentzea sokolovensis TaxID=3095429 RepID=A0ABU4UZQ9_9PSEU|nr:TetR/AcrR family transcriptional regulator [Lentzea sp. BCCO 10_0061]MDX8144155.1 TetR/AcrR family transcriptional regulator [Lentzea sp. BCCO 10_0061]
MTEATRRERLRAETEREIRQAARALLVESGRDAVTLRAIARKLGITAPALYRYYDSHDALLRQLCDDICADMAAALYADLAADTSGQVGCQVRAVCHAFRRWALAHPQEFALVFASPRDPLGADQFGSVFLQLAGRLIASNLVANHADDDVPEILHEDLARFQQVLMDAVSVHGVVVEDSVLNLGKIYHVVQSWVRLYGHVALEVFGRFPFAVSNPEPMFDSMLDQMLTDIGFEDSPNSAVH